LIYFNFDLNQKGPLDTLADLMPGNPCYDWLEQDLIYANSPQNRTQRPWIIAMGHRPLYCSSTKGKDCTSHAETFRRELEPLLNKYQVDLVLAGHVHDYERTLPVFEEKPTSESYVNPTSPTYIVNGAGGCIEGLWGFGPN